MKRNSLKRLTALMLSVLMLLGSSAMAAVNMDGLVPFVTEPVDVTIAAYPQPSLVWSEFDKENFGWIKWCEKYSGMNIDWQVYDPATRDETLPLMLAGGDMPDMIQGLLWEFADEINDYGVQQGLFYPIDELLQYMPTYSKILDENPALRAAMTSPDGHMYSLPILTAKGAFFPYRPWINTDWLDAVGMENPKTLDEFYAALKAFKEQDPNGNGLADEIPLGGVDNSAGEIVLRAYGFTSPYLGLDYSDMDNVRVAYTPYAEEYKDYLKFMNKLYAEGLYDANAFTQDLVENDAKLNENRIGCYVGNNPNLIILTMTDHFDHWWSLNAMTDKAGETPVIGVWDLTECYATNVISADCEPEKAAALAKLCDYYFTPEYFEYTWYGPELNGPDDPEGKGFYWDEEAQAGVFAGNTEGLSSWVYKITNYTFWIVPGYVGGNPEYEEILAARNPDSIVGKKVAAKGSYTPTDMTMIETLVPYYVPGLPPMYLDADELETCNILKAQLQEQVDMWTAKFITGELDIDEKYGEYITMLESYGVKELEAIQNAAYDIFKANMK